MDDLRAGSQIYSQQSTQNVLQKHENNDTFVVFKTYILQNYMSDIVRILLEDEINVHYCLKIDGCDLLENYVTLTDTLFFNPEKMLIVFDQAFHAALCSVFENHNLKEHMTLKPYLHVRFCKLPACSEVWRDRVPKSIDIGRFLVMEGTVIRTSSAKILEYKKEYMCTKCKNVFSLQADFQLHYSVPTPTSCPVNFECSGKKFVVMSGNDGTTGPKKCKDYQEIRVQEQVRKLSMGTIPRSLTVVLEDDLVDCCKPGDDIVIFGSVMCRWHPSTTGKPCDLELVLKANNIEVCNERHTAAGVDLEELQDEFQCFWATHSDETMMKARNHILASLCPQVYGLYVVKLAVALVLAGGVQRVDPSGSRVRGECHLLLVGDPGTGKSQFLKYAAKVTPRSVLTTGIGSSTAGLTVSAIRDGPHWTLEAGALVLADGGVCCIDEFSGIKEHDRSAIHEAMEQQTISVAKAGLVCKLNTRTSILAATNPKLGKYDEASSVAFNIAMASPLLSRFDLVLVLIDEKNLHWDSVVADYLLLGEEAGKQKRSDSAELWSLEQMQAYFGIIRQLNPTLSSEADQVLRAYYRSHRQSDSRNAARTTIRLLESLIRLSEAHARLMFRNVVTIQDAIAAVTVVESSMQGGSLLPTGSILHSCFPSDADAEYKKHAHLVLQCLNLEHLLSGAGSPTLPPIQNISQACKKGNTGSQLPTRDQSQLRLSQTRLKPSTHNTMERPTQMKVKSHFFDPKSQSSDKKNEGMVLTQSQVNNVLVNKIKITSKELDLGFSKYSSPVSSVSNTYTPSQRRCKSIVETRNPSSEAQCKSKPTARQYSPSVTENRSSIFRLDPSDADLMFNFDFSSSSPLAKKQKPDADTSEFNLSAIRNVTGYQRLSVESNKLTSTLNPFHDRDSFGASPAQTQVSLFAVDPIITPKSPVKSDWLCKNGPSVSRKACGKRKSNSKSNVFSRSKLFQIPENEANFLFSESIENDFLANKPSFSNKLSTAASNDSSNNQKPCVSFTLDPSMIEDLCGDYDL